MIIDIAIAIDIDIAMLEDLPAVYNWGPYNVQELESLLQGLNWILAGGYALEEYAGVAYRTHGDIDILLKRNKQNEIPNFLAIDRVYIAYQGRFSPFSIQKYYALPIQDIWVLSEDHKNWCLQIMLYDEDDGHWVYKRNTQIREKSDSIFWKKEGLKIIKPEIQLLYKSKNIRPKDQLDFEQIYPLLDPSSQVWLQEKLRLCYQEHPWMK